MTRPPIPKPLDVPKALAGLAREVDTIRRDLAGLRPTSGRVDKLADIVARLSQELAATIETTTAAAGQQEPKPAQPSWLNPAQLDGDQEDQDAAADRAVELLAGLIEWVQTVYVEYPDGARSLAGCWLWHPHAVEELLWLQRAHADAYGGPKAGPTLIGDWHDRQRPGVARRLHNAIGTCSVENHQPGRDAGAERRAAGHQLAEVAGPVAFWWATNRLAEPPAPSAAQLAAAIQVRPGRGRR